MFKNNSTLLNPMIKVHDFKERVSICKELVKKETSLVLLGLDSCNQFESKLVILLNNLNLSKIDMKQQDTTFIHLIFKGIFVQKYCKTMKTLRKY